MASVRPPADLYAYAGVARGQGVGGGCCLGCGIAVGQELLVQGDGPSVRRPADRVCVYGVVARGQGVRKGGPRPGYRCASKDLLYRVMASSGGARPLICSSLRLLREARVLVLAQDTGAVGQGCSLQGDGLGDDQQTHMRLRGCCARPGCRGGPRPGYSAVGELSTHFTIDSLGEAADSYAAAQVRVLGWLLPRIRVLSGRSCLYRAMASVASPPHRQRARLLGGQGVSGWGVFLRTTVRSRQDLLVQI